MSATPGKAGNDVRKYKIAIKRASRNALMSQKRLNEFREAIITMVLSRKSMFSRYEAWLVLNEQGYYILFHIMSCREELHASSFLSGIINSHRRY